MKAKIIAFSLLVLAVVIPARAITIVSADTPYTQNFDGLSKTDSANTWVNNSTLEGWYLFRQPASGTAITAYAAGYGSSSSGGFYSYGQTGSSDRALGGLGSGSDYFGNPSGGAVAGWIAVAFVNQIGVALSGFETHWNGEQWRNGGNADAQSMVFEYGFGDTFASVSQWIAPGGSFDWSSPVHTSTAAAVNGNIAGYVSRVGGSITDAWASGKTLWLRWVERNDNGNDHGLAIDDFSLIAKADPSSVPESPLSWFAGLSLLGVLALARRYAVQPARASCLPR